jgi:hypothetical protein
MQLIDKKTQEFQKEPFFAFLADNTIEPRLRLAFAPTVAHFVMTFGDLYSFVLREEPAKDKYQELVNAHTREDDGHWRWFLADLEKLGCDPQMRFSDAVRLVWADQTVRTRMLSYHMCRLGLRADSIRRLVLVHCIEAAGKVTVANVAAVGRAYSAQTGKRLAYFGAHHSDAETTHTVEQVQVRRMIDEIGLETQMRHELSTVVDESFQYFTAFADDMLQSAKKASAPNARP